MQRRTYLDVSCCHDGDVLLFLPTSNAANNACVSIGFAAVVDEPRHGSGLGGVDDFVLIKSAPPLLVSTRIKQVVKQEEEDLPE